MASLAECTSEEDADASDKDAEEAEAGTAAALEEEKIEGFMIVFVGVYGDRLSFFMSCCSVAMGQSAERLVQRAFQKRRIVTSNDGWRYISNLTYVGISKAHFNRLFL
mmetsp:Transcript_23690/g.47102  ORF Transcript_23690/g.47102 Transcript_23690/m.47102 type:complete len:108 (-) Transcript_23690:13-336(-)